jgi:L-xylulose reductase
VVKRLHSYGAKVYAVSRTEETLTSLKEECPSVNTICVDLQDWNATRSALENIDAVDALINNAGTGGMQPFLEITPEVFDE